MDSYIVRKGSVRNIRISYTTLCDLALLVYFCVMFAHQQENTFDTILRYGSFLFVFCVYILVYPPINRLKRQQTVRISTFEIWILFVFLYGAVSLFWSMDAGRSFHVLFNIGKTMVVCFLVYPHLNDRKSINRTLLLMLLALVYMMVLLILKTPYAAWGTERIGAAINQNSNEIGRLVCLGAVLTFYFMNLYKNNKWILVPVFFSFCAVALMTGSKNAIFIMIFQIGAFYYLISGKGRRILVLAGAIAVIYLIVYFVMNNDVLYGLVGIRMERMFRMLTGGPAVDGSTLERLYFMETAWKLFLHNPILGIGLNNFSAYLASIGYSNVVYSHCGFLELLSTLGAVGFCIYYFMYVKVIRQLMKPAFKKDLLAVLLFVVNLRVFLFDISSISFYTYNSYITLILGFASAQILKLDEKSR